MSVRYLYHIEKIYLKSLSDIVMISLSRACLQPISFNALVCRLLVWILREAPCIAGEQKNRFSSILRGHLAVRHSCKKFQPSQNELDPGARHRLTFAWLGGEICAWRPQGERKSEHLGGW